MPACLLACLELFGPVPVADQAPLLAAWESRTVREGELLFEAGPVCQELFFIQRGVLGVGRRGQRGRVITHSFRQAGQFCTLLASFEQQLPTTLNIFAACPAQVLAISRPRLAALGQQFPYLPGMLAQLSRQALLEKLHLHRAYQGQDAAARYETFLTQQPEVARQVPQHLIASYLGITPQSLSRLRRAGS